MANFYLQSHQLARKPWQMDTFLFEETLGAKLLPHSTLIKHRWDDIKSAIPDVDRELFFKYYGDYIDVYCGGLKHKCKASDFEDGPGAMSLGWGKFHPLFLT